LVCLSRDINLLVNLYLVLLNFVLWFLQDFSDLILLIIWSFSIRYGFFILPFFVLRPSSFRSSFFLLRSSFAFINWSFWYHCLLCRSSCYFHVFQFSSFHVLSNIMSSSCISLVLLLVWTLDRWFDLICSFIIVFLSSESYCLESWSFSSVNVFTLFNRSPSAFSSLDDQRSVL